MHRCILNTEQHFNTFKDMSKFNLIFFLYTLDGENLPINFDGYKCIQVAAIIELFAPHISLNNVIKV